MRSDNIRKIFSITIAMTGVKILNLSKSRLEIKTIPREIKLQ